MPDCTVASDGVGRLIGLDGLSKTVYLLTMNGFGNEAGDCNNYAVREADFYRHGIFFSASLEAEQVAEELDVFQRWWQNVPRWISHQERDLYQCPVTGLMATLMPLPSNTSRKIRRVRKVWKGSVTTMHDFHPRFAIRSRTIRASSNVLVGGFFGNGDRTRGDAQTHGFGHQQGGVIDIPFGQKFAGLGEDDGATRIFPR